MLTMSAAAGGAALPTRKASHGLMRTAPPPTPLDAAPAGSVMSSKQSKKDSADRVDADGSGVPAKLSKKELADRIQALCVLVVDDNQYMRKMVRNLLVNCGIKDIYEAGDGITALDTIRTVGPDVVVLDWEMPLLSGAELVRIVRSPGVFPMPDVPIIMLSGHGERWRVVEAVRLGVNEYLIKPVSAKALYDRLVSITLQPRPTVHLGDY
jgi:two-component system, chemotaxis family, chemotaxis protein CheY